MRRRDYVLLLTVLRELVCLGCIVLLIESKVAAQEAVAESAARPTWVDKAPYEDGDTYVWPVASGARNTYYSSAADAESMLRQAAVAAVKNFIEVRLIREEEAGEEAGRESGCQEVDREELGRQEIARQEDGQEALGEWAGTARPGQGPRYPEERA